MSFIGPTVSAGVSYQAKALAKTGWLSNVPGAGSSHDPVLIVSGGQILVSFT